MRGSEFGDGVSNTARGITVSMETLGEGETKYYIILKITEKEGGIIYLMVIVFTALMSYKLEYIFF